MSSKGKPISRQEKLPDPDKCLPAERTSSGYFKLYDFELEPRMLVGVIKMSPSTCPEVEMDE